MIVCEYILLIEAGIFQVDVFGDDGFGYIFGIGLPENLQAGAAVDGRVCLGEQVSQ